MDYEYDVFISYSSIDVSWAERLERDLLDKDLRVFFDRKRLLAGGKWEEDLKMSLRKSQHIAILWSNHARESDWVLREMNYFDMRVNDDVQPDTKDHRRLIFIVLEGEPKAFDSIQKIYDLKQANAYPGDAASIAAPLWDGVLQKVDNAISKDDPSTPVSLAVLAMTLDELREINPAQKPIFGPSLNDLLRELEITMPQLEGHYGAKRTDWRPFGSGDTVEKILNTLRDDLRKELPKNIPTLRWDPIDEAFWTDSDVAAGEAAKLLSGQTMSLIVIDPISLYHSLVHGQLTALSKCFENDKSLIMVLSPRTLPNWFEVVRGLVEKRGRPFFDTFFKPPVPIDRLHAHCGVNIGNQTDIGRLLRSGLGYVRKVQPGNNNPVFRMGGN